VIHSFEVCGHKLLLDVSNKVGGFGHQDLVKAIEANGKIVMLINFHQLADDVVQCL